MPDIVRKNRFNVDEVHTNVLLMDMDEAINGARTGRTVTYAYINGHVNITGTGPVDVSTAETAGVSDANLRSENIRQGASILGISGTYAGIVPSGTLNIVENGDFDVTNKAAVHVAVPVPEPSGTLTITQNGTYTFAQLSQYETVIINITTEENVLVDGNALVFDGNTYVDGDTLAIEANAIVDGSTLKFR